MASDSVDKRALLISPSYDLLPQKQRLNGTARDIEFMRELTKDLSFSVTEVVGKNATKINILQAVDELSEAATDGSVVLLYYSGHGFCLRKPIDEGLVPADATLEMLSKSPVKVCITGLDFCPYLTRLSEKRVKCTLIFDCCFSGHMYRDPDLKEVQTDARTRHIILDEGQGRTGKDREGSRGGWTPNSMDHFVYIAACSPVQFAWEDGQGGYLTSAIKTVIASLKNVFKQKNCFKDVSHQAFWGLIKREFIERGWNIKQMPQIEGFHFNREIFGVNNVPTPRSGIEVKEVNGNEVILSAGYLQNLSPGKYDVFKATVTEEVEQLGRESSAWLGTVDVDENKIDNTVAYGKIVSHGELQISHGCLAYLVTPWGVLSSVLVQVSPNTVPGEKIDALMTQLQKTNRISVSREAPKIQDEDLITIAVETVKTNDSSGTTNVANCNAWVARRGGLVIVPPLSVEEESGTMAENLSRYLRYNLALSRAISPSEHESLQNVSFVMKRIEKVEPIPKNDGDKTKFVEKWLENGQDMYPTACGQLPCLTSHRLEQRSSRCIDGTGDAFVFQVKNSSETSVHICVLVFQFDGGIKLVYPPSEGRTGPLGGKDTVEKICRVTIPPNTLRSMAQPDLSLPEPDMGTDTVVLYATSREMNFGALLQGDIKVDPKLVEKRSARKGQEKTEELTNLEKFLSSLDGGRNLVDDDENPLKYFIEKKAFNVMKNRPDDK